MRNIDRRVLQDILARHLPVYQKKVPSYQAVMLETLSEVWVGSPRKLLDIGGGTGVIAQAISELFPVGEVQAVDVVDRFCSTLSVKATKYDGQTLPFTGHSFDAATLNNVVHHVPIAGRANLLREIRRVVDGPVYIKDHESRGSLDNVRLTAMDAIGNIPFGGMIWARYLDNSEWETLAKEAGYLIAARAAPARYRQGAYEGIFPNRLEITMRFEPG